jgi:hypothetical protein
MLNMHIYRTRPTAFILLDKCSFCTLNSSVWHLPHHFQPELCLLYRFTAGLFCVLKFHLSISQLCNGSQNTNRHYISSVNFTQVRRILTSRRCDNIRSNSPCCLHHSHVIFTRLRCKHIPHSDNQA